MDLKPLVLPPHQRRRIAVLGYIVRGPLGGLVWHHLQYALGLHLMGHEVLFVEDSEDYPACYHPEQYQMTADPSYGLAFLQQAFQPFGLGDKWAYYDAHTRQWYGKSASVALDFLKNADLLLNLSGVSRMREWFLDIPARALVDTDPVFSQIRYLTEPEARKEAAMHTAFFSFGERFGEADCLIPDDGFPWAPTRQPVVNDIWATDEAAPSDAPWTTVMQWDSYKARVYEGRTFGMKSASFGPYLGLPALVSERIELALGSESAPREELKSAGWGLRDPLSVTRTPEDYRQYILASRGEWSVAKQGYTISRSGWFSERSAAYLASGRPVIVQDTGFSGFIKTGEGLFAFNNPDEARAAFESVRSRYERHCKAASEIARQYFDASSVLTRLLERV